MLLPGMPTLPGQPWGCQQMQTPAGPRDLRPPTSKHRLHRSSFWSRARRRADTSRPRQHGSGGSLLLVPLSRMPQLAQDKGHHHSWPQGLISKGNNGHERGTKVPASATTFCQGASGDPRRAWTPLHPKILAPSGPDTLKKQLSL